MLSYETIDCGKDCEGSDYSDSDDSATWTSSLFSDALSNDDSYDFVDTDRTSLSNESESSSSDSFESLESCESSTDDNKFSDKKESSPVDDTGFADCED